MVVRQDRMDRGAGVANHRMMIGAEKCHPVSLGAARLAVMQTPQSLRRNYKGRGLAREIVNGELLSSNLSLSS